MGRTDPKWDCISEASAGAGEVSGMLEADGADLNCYLGFKAFHKLTNTGVAGLCFQVGANEAMKSTTFDSGLLLLDASQLDFPVS